MNIKLSLAVVSMALSSSLLSPAFAQPIAPPASGVPSPRELTHPSASDKQLIKSVRRHLARTRGLDPSNISVLSHNGVVYLTGTVTNQSQADLAASSASQVPDVLSVVDKLTIRAPM
jgi:hyperosmotically inducible protein